MEDCLAWQVGQASVKEQGSGMAIGGLSVFED